MRLQLRYPGIPDMPDCCSTAQPTSGSRSRERPPTEHVAKLEVCHFNAAFDRYSQYHHHRIQLHVFWSRFCILTLTAQYTPIRPVRDHKNGPATKVSLDTDGKAFSSTPRGNHVKRSTSQQPQKSSISKRDCSRYHKHLYTIAPDPARIIPRCPTNTWAQRTTRERILDTGSYAVGSVCNNGNAGTA